MYTTYIHVIGIVVILIVLIFIYVRIKPQTNHYENERQRQVNNTIQWLYKAVNDICYRCNMSPNYKIIETDQITYTDKIINNTKGTINLVIWNERYDRTFNNNTLMYATLHEVAHILSPTIHHEPPFDSIESILINMATNLGYYDPTIPMEANYTTLH